MLERPIEVERVRVSGWCRYVSMQLTVVAGLAEAVAVLVETRPSKQPGKMVCGGAGA